MELIERYIYAVTRRLPEKQREDIARELRGLIEDMLAEQAGGSETDEKDTEAVLRQLGEPAKLAGKYSGRPCYIIGPELYYTYTGLLKIVLPAVAFGMFVATAIRYITAPPSQIGETLHMAAYLIATPFFVALQVFAWMTVIFALVERYSADIHKKWESSGDWDPADLPEVPVKHAAIRRSEPIAGIVFLVIFMAVFNVAADKIGLYHLGAGSYIPLFSPAVLHAYLPFINVCFIIGLCKEGAKLLIGRYSIPFAVIHLALSAVSCALGLFVFSHFSIWNPDFGRQLASVCNLSLSPEQATLTGAKVVLGLIVFSFAVETIQTFFRAFRYGGFKNK